MWRRVFWYFSTSVLKKNVEDAGCRFFQTSGTLLQMFQRKMLKIKAADFSKILVHFYKCLKKNAEDTGSRFFQISGTFLRMFRRKLLKI
jgi:uncharacterized protein YggT (Ycf19 family)